MCRIWASEAPNFGVILVPKTKKIPVFSHFLQNFHWFHISLFSCSLRVLLGVFKLCAPGALFLSLEYKLHWSLLGCQASWTFTNPLPEPLMMIQSSADIRKSFHPLPDWKCILATFYNTKHDYIKKFYWSFQIFHWTSGVFTGRGYHMPSLDLYQLQVEIYK